MDVLLAGDGEAIAGGRIVAPVLDDGDHAFIDWGTEPAEQSGADDVSVLVDGDFNDDVAFESWRTNGAGNGWIRIDHRVSRANFVSVGVTVRESSIGSTGGAVAGWRESAGHRWSGRGVDLRGAPPGNVELGSLNIVNIGGFMNLLSSAVFQINRAVTGAAHSVKSRLGLDVVRQWLPDEKGEDHRMDGHGGNERPRGTFRVGFWREKHVGSRMSEVKSQNQKQQLPLRLSEFNPISLKADRVFVPVRCLGGAGGFI